MWNSATGVPAEAKSRLEKGERRLIPVDEGMSVVYTVARQTSRVCPVHNSRRHACSSRATIETCSWWAGNSGEAPSGGGVQLVHGWCHQLLTYYGYPHRTRKWWRRAFFFLFDAAVVNSYTLYCQQHHPQGRTLTHEQFRIELAKDLLAAANSTSPVPSTSPSSSSRGHRQEVLNPQSLL